MADLEKVIRGLECCKDPMITGVKCNICPYWDDENPDEYQTSCNDNLCADALELLKEQEPIAPKQASTLFGSTLRWWYVCGNCRLEIRDGENKWQYCPRCGRPVEWDSSCVD